MPKEGEEQDQAQVLRQLNAQVVVPSPQPRLSLISSCLSVRSKDRIYLPRLSLELELCGKLWEVWEPIFLQTPSLQLLNTLWDS
jgi:hypothetical protein